MKHFITILITLFIGFSGFSQRKNRGDRFFENGDYLNAITSYKKELERANHSKNNIEKLATCYYNTFQFKEAYRYLRYVTKGRFKGKDKSYDNNFNFKLYHVLSALGEYDKAIPYLELYQKNRNLESENRTDVIATIEDFKLKDDDYTIKISPLNTKSAEFGAVKKDSVIYFTSDRSPNNILETRYKWTHRPFLDIYKVTVDSVNQPTGNVRSFSQKINSGLHEGNFCFTADGKTLYLSKSNNERGKRKFDSIKSNPIQLYKAIKNDSLNTWSKPEKLAFNDVSFTSEHPTLSADEKKLYFSSNRPGGYGEFDLYVVNINEDGTYSKPKNLGETINTPHREQFPFIAENGDLFFSSNGHLGLGMLDVFACKNVNNTFSKPVNLGAPINSSFDDFSLTYYNDKNGFFASNRKKAGDDIYSFSQIGEVFPEPLQIRFEVRDAVTKEFISNTSVTLTDKKEKEILNKTLDSISVFDITILPGRYNLVASAKQYNTNAKSFFVTEKEDEIYTLYLTKKAVF